MTTARRICASALSSSGGRGSRRSVARIGEPRIDLSPLIAFASWDELAAARADPAAAGAGADAEAVEGVMLKRRDAPYLPGRPKGLWWKWKRDPFIVDAVLMYAQRGHGKRSSFYSDYTFGVWTSGEDGDELVPVGKAYFGFTDEELMEIDRFVRRNTIERFGPVREIVHEPDQGLVLEVAFEGLQRSTRHKSGLAMRFPAHQPAALGQAAGRGRPAGAAGNDDRADRGRARRVRKPSRPAGCKTSPRPDERSRCAPRHRGGGFCHRCPVAPQLAPPSYLSDEAR